VETNLPAMSTGEALLALDRLDHGANAIDRVDWAASMTLQGVPQEIITALDGLWYTTKAVGGKIFQIGKIILMHLLEFMEKQADLFLGVPIGAKIGIAISALVELVPYVGPFLLPIFEPIGMVVGGLLAFNLFKSTGLGQSLFSLAKDFFKFLAAVLHSLVDILSE
jgi:hypothetical protein